MTKTIFNLFFLLLLPLGTYCQDKTATATNAVSPSDLAMLLGDWEGTLTYIDYSSNKPYTMPANLKVTPGKNDNQYVLSNIFPNEPKANSKSKLKLSKDGTRFNKKTVSSRKVLENGQIQIRTEYEGKDGNDNKKAIIRMTYTLEAGAYTIWKEVQFEGTSGWIKRSGFDYRKK